MTKQELNKKAEGLFKQYKKEDRFYCIDDGNFWFSKDKVSASVYSKKLSKELFTIDRVDLKETVVTEDKKVTKKRVSRKKTKK